jgi:hypothetical protein
MLKKPASGVLASFRSSTYPRGYASGPSLAAALLDGLFEHPGRRTKVQRLHLLNEVRCGAAHQD